MDATAITDPTLRGALDLTKSMRELSARTFTLLHEITEATRAAQASIPSPPAQAIDNEIENKDAKTAEGEGHSEDTTMNTKRPGVFSASAAKAELVSTYKFLMAISVRLRGVNRQAQIILRESKARTAEKLSEVDKLQLELENVYYRQSYLRSEIEKCLDFPSLHSQVNFVPLEEFYEAHPEFDPGRIKETSTVEDEPTTAPNNDDQYAEHEIMMARLRDERDRRLELEAKRRELVAVKANLVAENKRRKDDLEGLDKQLQQFIESASPIQNVLHKY
ncbi:Fms-interacting protein-domain-containing protein [Limtongia smithiae]|uniref:Fms-interacting protein-domain-containing protein n=1 Tax=Limtongia smithiae TaxID=1125753 RepID=UPI0034CE41B7